MQKTTLHCMEVMPKSWIYYLHLNIYHIKYKIDGDTVYSNICRRCYYGDTENRNPQLRVKQTDKHFKTNEIKLDYQRNKRICERCEKSCYQIIRAYPVYTTIPPTCLP